MEDHEPTQDTTEPLSLVYEPNPKHKPIPTPGRHGSICPPHADGPAVRWERFAGNEDSFAVRLAFMPDPDEGVGADPVDAASWGSVEFWVHGQNLCAHVDQNETLRSAHWYLLPLIEWFAANWNPLLHEEKLPNRNIAETAAEALELTRFAPPLAGEAETLAWEKERYQWRGRHAIRKARSGGLFPNLVIRRVRDLVELSWNAQPLAGAPYNFRYSSAQGSALLTPDQVARPLYEVLSAATNHLAEVAPDDAGRLAALQRSIRQISDPAQNPSRVEWLAGVRGESAPPERLHHTDPQTKWHVRWSEIVEELQELGTPDSAGEALRTESDSIVVTGSCHAALMFSSMSPTVTPNDVRTVTAVLVEQYSPDPVLTELTTLSRPAPMNNSLRPWEQGYDLAETLHAELNIDLSAGWVDVHRLIERLGVRVLERHLDDPKIRACCLVGRHHTPTVIQNTSSSFFRSTNAQRFNLAHELCHLLYDRSSAQKVAIASGPWAPRSLEQRANAFAAMFLMPLELIEAAIADPIHDITWVSSLATELRINRRPLIDHLYNLTLMSEAERDELLDGAELLARGRRSDKG
ncbi:ImmA/IrrE family metallo-endopeptidase [Micromonospora sp. NPDC000207]|uniref:ImmA/IrrE family metallo-endopeptidase n=1 Tax=Micromonospora sp. NPDC000207 TaxID=3154246 RepID=UPI0033343B38